MKIGESVVEMPAKDLQAAFSEDQVSLRSTCGGCGNFMRRILLAQFLAQPVPELLVDIPWGHHVEFLK